WTATATSADADTVTLTGQTSANARILVYRSPTTPTPALSGSADATGQFTFTGVAVAPGSNFFRVVAAEAAGNTSYKDGTYFSTAPDKQPPVLSIRLAHNTGVTPGLTYDATVTGTV